MQVAECVAPGCDRPREPGTWHAGYCLPHSRAWHDSGTASVVRPEHMTPNPLLLDILALEMQDVMAARALMPISHTKEN